MPGDRHQCKRLPLEGERQGSEKGETSQKAVFFISNSGCAAGSSCRDRIEEWTVFNRSEAHFSTPPSSDKNMIRSHHMDMPHYSMNTISHNASFTRRS